MIHSVRRLSHYPRPMRRIALSMIAAGLVGIGLSLALFAATIVYGLSGFWISLLLGTSGLAPFIAISLWFVPRTAALARRLKETDYRLCPECEHDLSALPDAAPCPECGRLFDPARDRAAWRDVITRRLP